MQQNPRWRRALLRLRIPLLAVVITLAGVVGVAAPASADTSLCGGVNYSVCVGAGYTDHGYSANSGNSYWHAYSGHNCTNYAAFDLIQNGAPSTYWPGYAYQWGPYFGYNGTPAVGSIAWWAASYHGASSYGHVAYVEAVLPDGSIKVSEDSAPYTGYPNGWFDWRVISPGSGAWPSGFIHVKDLTPAPAPVWNGVGNATYLGSDHLVNGQQMHSNQYLLSSDGRFVLMMQSDGNLVEYTASGALWNSGTGGHPGAWLVVQPDGNVVVYSATGVALWSTGSSAIYSFVVQNDANVVGYASSGQPVWWTGGVSTANLSSKGTDTLSTGMDLVAGQYLVSADGRYHALMQPDGNFVVYAPGYRVLWNSGTGGSAGAHVIVQPDGNVVIYSATGVALWYTTPVGISRLAMQDDGNLVGYDPAGAAKWYSATSNLL